MNDRRSASETRVPPLPLLPITQLIKPDEFAQSFVTEMMRSGFGALSKRDMELLVFFLLEKDGSIGRSATNHIVAEQLRLPIAKLKGLRRDAYARWRHLRIEEPAEQLRAVCMAVFTSKNIEVGALHTSKAKRKEGFVAIRVEHADDRAQLEQVILDLPAIPIYERNPDVMLIHFQTVTKLAEKFGFLEPDAKTLRASLKAILPSSEDLSGFLRKNIKDLTWNDARAALNLAGVKVLEGAFGDVEPIAILKLALPFVTVD